MVSPGLRIEMVAPLAGKKAIGSLRIEYLGSNSLPF